MTTARPLGRRATLFSVLAIGTVLFGLVLAVRAGAGTSPATPRLTSRASTRAAPAQGTGRRLHRRGDHDQRCRPGDAVSVDLCRLRPDRCDHGRERGRSPGLVTRTRTTSTCCSSSPGGQNAIFMSDAGGQTDLVNCDLTIDDEAPAVLPDDTQIACPGNYQPANYEPGDPFPAPAPAPSGSVALSTFDGGTPNGTWSLYVVDDAAVDVGSIAGWSLTIAAGGPRRLLLRHLRRLRHRRLRLRRHRPRLRLRT